MPEPEHTSPTRKVAFAAETKRRPGRLILRILDGETPGDVTIDAPVVTVGRSSLAEVCVRERSISSVHFELRATTTGATLRDLGSTNGVWFHERRIPAVELAARCSPGMAPNLPESRATSSSRVSTQVDSRLSTGVLMILEGSVRTSNDAAQRWRPGI